MDVDKIKKGLISKIKYTVKQQPILGGQQCGVMPHSIVLTCEELDIEITVGHFKTQLKNKKFALKLYELALNELINLSNEES